jgi:hypothetical protein
MWALKRNGGVLNLNEQNMIKITFPGMASESSNERLNIARLYDQEYNNIINSMYNKVDFANAKNPDEATDNLGFLGVPEWYREKKDNMQSISQREFVTVVAGKNNKLKEVVFTIN